MSYFWSPNKGLREGEEEEGEEEEERERSSQGMDTWILHGFWYDFCTQTTWVWIARVFFVD